MAAGGHDDGLISREEIALLYGRNRNKSDEETKKMLEKREAEWREVLHQRTGRQLEEFKEVTDEPLCRTV